MHERVEIKCIKMVYRVQTSPDSMLSIIIMFLYSVHVVLLLLFMQMLDEEEYKSWKEGREAAELSLEEREEKIYQSTCRIEHKLELLGEE